MDIELDTNSGIDSTARVKSRAYTDAADSQPTSAATTGGLAGVVARLQGFDDSATWTRVRLQGADGDAAAVGIGYLKSAARMQAFNGATWDRIRMANKFINLNAVVVNPEATIWTPGAGKKFRLMGFVLTQGVITGPVLLKDNTAGSTILIIPPNTVAVVMPSVFIGNGILSAAANNVLTATGVATETLTGFLFGTEE